MNVIFLAVMLFCVCVDGMNHNDSSSDAEYNPLQIYKNPEDPRNPAVRQDTQEAQINSEEDGKLPILGHCFAESGYENPEERITDKPKLTEKEKKTLNMCNIFGLKQFLIEKLKVNQEELDGDLAVEASFGGNIEHRQLCFLIKKIMEYRAFEEDEEKSLIKNAKDNSIHAIKKMNANEAIKYLGQLHCVNYHDLARELKDFNEDISYKLTLEDVIYMKSQYNNGFIIELEKLSPQALELTLKELEKEQMKMVRLYLIKHIIKNSDFDLRIMAQDGNLNESILNIMAAEEIDNDKLANALAELKSQPGMMTIELAKLCVLTGMLVRSGVISEKQRSDATKAIAENTITYIEKMQKGPANLLAHKKNPVVKLQQKRIICNDNQNNPFCDPLNTGQILVIPDNTPQIKKNNSLEYYGLKSQKSINKKQRICDNFQKKSGDLFLDESTLSSYTLDLACKYIEQIGYGLSKDIGGNKSEKLKFIAAILDGEKPFNNFTTRDFILAVSKNEFKESLKSALKNQNINESLIWLKEIYKYNEFSNVYDFVHSNFIELSGDIYVELIFALQDEIFRANNQV